MGFVDKFVSSKDTMISYLTLVEKPDDGYVSVCSLNFLSYKNPFEVKPFADDKFWDEGQSIKFKCTEELQQRLKEGIKFLFIERTMEER